MDTHVCQVGTGQAGSGRVLVSGHALRSAAATYVVIYRGLDSSLPGPTPETPD